MGRRKTGSPPLPVVGVRRVGMLAIDPSARAIAVPYDGVASLIGAGDVHGPAGSVTDNAIARFDGTDGKHLQEGAATLEDDGRITNLTDPVNPQDAATKSYVDAGGGGGGGGTVTHTGALTAHAVVLGNGSADIAVLGSLGTATTLLHGNASGDPSFSAVDLAADVTGTLASAHLPTGATTRAITCAIDGGGSALTTGVKADVYVPYACTITGVTMLADQSGSAVVDIWAKAYSSYPPTVTDTITGSAPPTISSATKSQDTTLTGWTTSVGAGDCLRFNINSASTITRLVLVLTVTVS